MAPKQQGEQKVAGLQDGQKDAFLGGIFALLGKDVIMRLVLAAIDALLPKSLSPEDQAALDKTKQMLQASQAE